MYKRCQHYNSQISKADLEKELDTHYTGETDLVISLMSRKIQDGTIQTRNITRQKMSWWQSTN